MQSSVNCKTIKINEGYFWIQGAVYVNQSFENKLCDNHEFTDCHFHILTLSKWNILGVKNWPISCTFPSLTGLGSDINVRHLGETCWQQWAPGQDSQRTECIPWKETSLLSKVSSSLSQTCKDCSLPMLDAFTLVKAHGITACEILFNTWKQN